MGKKLSIAVLLTSVFLTYAHDVCLDDQVSNDETVQLEKLKAELETFSGRIKVYRNFFFEKKEPKKNQLVGKAALSDLIKAVPFIVLPGIGLVGYMLYPRGSSQNKEDQKNQIELASLSSSSSLKEEVSSDESEGHDGLCSDKEEGSDSDVEGVEVEEDFSNQGNNGIYYYTTLTK